MSFFSFEKISELQSRRIRYILIAVIGVSILFVFFHPLNLINYYFPGVMRSDSSCIMLNLTGLRCPFCGMSRSFKELIDFDIAGSFYYNPSSVIVFAFIGTLCLSIFVLSIFNYKVKFDFNKKTFILFLMVIAIIWVLNILFGHN